MPKETNNKLTLIGVPIELGAQNLGVEDGPEALRSNGIISTLEGLGFKVNDLGNIDCKKRALVPVGNPRMRHLDEILRVNNELANMVHEAISSGTKAVVMGGDHCLSLGSVSGASAALDGNLGLIYIDAHGDINTEESTLTGNVHGMQLASLLGFGADKLKTLHSKNIKITKDNLLHIGGSDLDPPELDLVRDNHLTVFMLFDLLRFNLDPLLKLIDNIASRTPNIWVSLDLDVIDKRFAPGVGIPNTKGLTYREVAAICEYIGFHCNVVGIDIVEYNPLQDEHNKTAGLGIELAANLLGKKYSWYSDYMKDNQVN